MDDLVEKVARALHKHAESNRRRASGPVTDELDSWGLYVPAARAAIEAMREPTDDVADAMNAATANGTVNWRDYHAAMIDAALTPTGKIHSGGEVEMYGEGEK
mgnify:CR=1 FL=1